MAVDDRRIAEARGKDIMKIATALDINWMIRGFPERTGHCPVCGGAEKPGADRFSLNLQKQTFYCRKCDVGGDSIGLVRFVRGCTFVEALDWMLGPAEKLKIETPEERKTRLDKEEAQAKARDATAEKERQKVIADARRLWNQGKRPQGTPVEAYLQRRAIDVGTLGGFPPCIRFHPDLPYAHHIDGAWVTVHRGPAMICAVQNAAGKFSALHRTYLDLDQPKGKAVIRHPQTGEVLDAKKGLGSKKGGAIRLSGDRVSGTLIMGEGIETTYSAWMALAGTAPMFWAGIDLGNMSGRQAKLPGRRDSGLPDMEDDRSFVPPPGVSELILVMDGDSAPGPTRAKLLAGARRAMLLRPGLRAKIAPAPNGFDLNDVLMGAVAEVSPDGE